MSYVLCFGQKPPTKSVRLNDADPEAAPAGVVAFLFLGAGANSEDENIRQIVKYHDYVNDLSTANATTSARAFGLNRSESIMVDPTQLKYPLRTSIRFADDNDPLVKAHFIERRHLMKWLNAENPWGDAALDEVDWSPLHLAAFLGQDRLAEKIIELDEGRCTYQTSGNYTYSIMCQPDAMNRLPLDVAIFMKQQKIVSGKPITDKLLALLSPVATISEDGVKFRREIPKENLYFAIGFLCIFQALILIETLINTDSTAVRVLCGVDGGVILLTVMSRLYFTHSSNRRDSTQLPLLGSFTRIFLSVILFVKVLVVGENLDYSQFFLAVANTFEDIRTTAESLKLECSMYGQRLFVPAVDEDSEFDKPAEIPCSEAIGKWIEASTRTFVNIYQSIIFVLTFLPARVIVPLFCYCYFHQFKGSTEKWVRSRLRTFDGERPDNAKATEKVQTLLGSFGMLLAADVIFVTVALVLAIVN